MKSKHIIVLMAMALPTLGLQSCLDYDNPGDEFNSTTKNVEKVTSRGDVDKIPFRQATDAAAADGGTQCYARLARCWCWWTVLYAWW